MFTCKHANVKSIKHFLSSCCLLLGIHLMCEKLTWRRGGAYVGATWPRKARLDSLGSLESSFFFKMEGLRLLLTLTHEIIKVRNYFSFVIVFNLCVCDRCRDWVPYRLWWVCHLIFKDLHCFIMRVWLLRKHLSITFPTNTHT